MYRRLVKVKVAAPESSPLGGTLTFRMLKSVVWFTSAPSISLHVFQPKMSPGAIANRRNSGKFSSSYSGFRGCEFLSVPKGEGEVPKTP